jgi:hypothetical protein
VLLIALSPLLYLLGCLVELTLSPPDDTVWAPLVVFRRLALGLLIAGWVGVALAELGYFSLLTLVVLLATASAFLAVRLACQLTRPGWWRSLAHAGSWSRPREALAVGVLLAIAVALFMQPGEDVLGARDPGIYFATGVAIAREGGVLQSDGALRALGDHLGDESVNWWLFQSVHGWPLRFPGQLFVRDLYQGTVEPGFLPWYPVAIAVAVDSAGVEGGIWVNPVLATLAVLATYFAGRALFGPVVAWAGAALLTLNLAQVWFARYTMAEPATQLFVWLGIYALVALVRRPTLGMGALAGLAWASTLLVRVDAVLLVPPIAALLAWRARDSAERGAALLALALIGFGAAHSALHAWRFAPGYTSMTFSGGTLAVAAGGVAAALAAAGLTWLLLAPVAVNATSESRRRVALLIALLAVAGAAAYLLRPGLAAPMGDDERAALDVAAHESLVRLGWYVTPLALALAVIAAARLLWSGRWRRAASLLALLGLSLAFYLPNPLVSSDQPWAARRYLPVVLPGVLLLAAYGAGWCGWWLGRRARRRRWLGWVCTGALCLAVALGEWRTVAPIAAYREDAGTLAQIEALAELVPTEAIVLFPRSAAGMRLSLPLHYIGRRASFVLPAEGPVEGVLSVVRRWRAEGRPVYWVVPLGTRFPTPEGVRFVPAGQFRFETSQLERPLDRLPGAAEPLRFELQLYRIEVVRSEDGH